MKKRLYGSTIQYGLIKGSVKTGNWTLCIGAGTSCPIFPSWKELVGAIILDIYPDITDEAKTEILNSFDLDTLIQAACNIKGESSFADWLSEKLYSKLKNQIPSNDWGKLCKILTAHIANIYKDKDWNTFIKYRDTLFKQTTAYSLAKVLVDSYGSTLSPSAILSFNAEPLLYSLINSFIREKAIGKKFKGCCPELLELHTLSALPSQRGRIPYYYCHGALLDWISPKKRFIYNAKSKLVFSENQYLSLSNSVYSWQSTIFLNACVNSVVVFIGVSLSDSNMRKWLNCVQIERNKDIGNITNSTKHFWITKIPQNKETMDWMEASVLHLGVRIIWIEEWNQTSDVLKKIIGLN